MLQRTGAGVGSGVEFAHDAFEDAGAQLGPAQADQPGSQIGVEAGEGVVAGTGQVAVGAGEWPWASPAGLGRQDGAGRTLTCWG